MQGTIALCCMVEGFSNPWAQMPLRSASFRDMSSKFSHTYQLVIIVIICVDIILWLTSSQLELIAPSGSIPAGPSYLLPPSFCSLGWSEFHSSFLQHFHWLHNSFHTDKMFDQKYGLGMHTLVVVLLFRPSKKFHYYFFQYQ